MVGHKSSNWAVGAETMGRDYTIYDHVVLIAGQAAIPLVPVEAD